MPKIALKGNIESMLRTVRDEEKYAQSGRDAYGSGKKVAREHV